MLKPTIQTLFSAGADLHAAEDVIIHPGEFAVVSTGYIYHVDKPDTVGLVRGRSGLAFRHRVFAFEGTIDPDYAGNEVKVLLENRSGQPFVVGKGDRIAQIIITKCETGVWFGNRNKERTSGFGSTNLQ